MATETLNLALKTTGSRVVIDAIGATKLAFSALSGVIAATIGAALESEKATARLATSLEIAGRGGKDVVTSMLQYSDELARVTLFTDEAITKSQALFAQLTDLDQNGIQRATKAAIEIGRAHV